METIKDDFNAHTESLRALKAREWRRVNVPDPSMEWKSTLPYENGWYWVRGVKNVGPDPDGREIHYVEGDPDDDVGPFPAYAIVDWKTDPPLIVLNSGEFCFLHNFPRCAEWWGPFHAPR